MALKVFECTYRKRGLTGSEEKTELIEAESFYEASYMIQKKIGEENVVLRVRRKEEE